MIPGICARCGYVSDDAKRIGELERELAEAKRAGETVIAFSDALREQRNELAEQLTRSEARCERLGATLGGLLDAIDRHREGRCDGITPKDCLDAIYEGAKAIHASALAGRKEER